MAPCGLTWLRKARRLSTRDISQLSPGYGSGQTDTQENIFLHGTNKEHCGSKKSQMIVIDGTFLAGLAAVITSLSGLVWAMRRRR